MPRVLRAAVVALSLLVPVLASAPAAGAAVDPRYALVHGCYALQSPATGKFVVKTPMLRPGAKSSGGIPPIAT